MMGALDQLLLPSTWEGTDEEKNLALNRAANLKDIIAQASVLTNDVEAPYWDDEADADDELPPDEQPWYGVFVDDTFQATIENWVIAAFVAYASGPAAALTFLTLAKQFRLALRKHDLGGVVRVFVNAGDHGTIDTYSATPGIIEQDYVGDPDEDEQQILLVLEESPMLAFAAGELPSGAPMQVIRKKLTRSEVSSPNLRYDVTCNCIQQTTDGGTTWIDQPGADVRHSDAWRLPASTEPDIKCDAAARIVAAWQEDLELLYQTTNVSVFASGILQALLVLAGGAGVLIDLIILALEALITIGVSTIQAAFTSDVWDGIECIIYCHIGDDGQVSADQAEAILADVAVVYPGTVYNTLVQLQNLYGEVLMSNAGVERDESGDCDECVCSCCHRWFDVGSTNIIGNYTIREWQSPLSPPIGFTSIEMHYKLNPNPGGTLVDANLDLRLGGTLIESWSLTELEGTETWTGGGSANSFSISVNSDFTLGSNYPDLLEVVFNYICDPDITWEGGENC